MQPIPKQLQEVLFEKAIPGQSLTNAVDQKYPWEQPPQMTSLKQAREKIFLDLLQPKNVEAVQDLMIDKIPVNAIAEIILTEGFRKGKFNPDMMLNLLEPTMYMLMAIAEKSGIEPIVDSGEPDEDDDESIAKVKKLNEEFMSEKRSFRDAKVNNINRKSVGEDIANKIDKMELAKPKSLLEREKKAVGGIASVLSKATQKGVKDYGDLKSKIKNKPKPKERDYDPGSYLTKEEKQEIMIDILIERGYSKKEIQKLLDNVYKKGQSDEMVEALGIPKNVDEILYAESIGFHPWIEATPAREALQKKGLFKPKYKDNDKPMDFPID